MKKIKMVEVFTGETITGTDIDIAIWMEDLINLFYDEDLTFVEITEEESI